jgi:threonine aldolase
MLVDLRSDTVTKPSKEMLDAMADPDVAELVKMFSVQIRP